MNHGVMSMVLFMIVLSSPVIAEAQSYNFVIEDTVVVWSPPGTVGLVDAPSHINREVRENLVGNRFSVELVGSYARVSMSWMSESPFLDKVETDMFFGSFGESGIYSMEFTKSFGRVNGGVFASTVKLPLDNGEEVIMQTRYFFARR